MKFIILAATAGLLAGCGFAPARLAAELAEPIAVESNSAPLLQLAVGQLGEKMHDEQSDVRLVLSERLDENIAGRGPGGNASIVRISYRLGYRLEGKDGSLLHESEFRFSENIAHDDAALRASLLSRQRAFDLTRKRALRRILQETAAVLADERTAR